MRAPLVTVVATGLLTLGCAADPSAPRAASPDSGPCSKQARLAHGGSFFETTDGKLIWFKLAGPVGAPTIAFLHGGPGYNAMAFEKRTGKLLEANYRVLYFDQRGAGRSGADGPDSDFAMAKTIADLDQLRAASNISRLIVMGHSFGGLVAAEYAHRYPERVSAIIMLDTAEDISRALTHQVAFVDTNAETLFPELAAQIHAIARAEEPSIEKLGKLYGAIGRLPLQRQLMFGDARTQQEMETLDEEANYTRCTSAAVTSAYKREGYLSSRVPSAAKRLTAPALLIGGRKSQVIGEQNIRDAAAAWGAQLQWLDAGHFVYFDDPSAFVALIDSFLAVGAGSR